MNQVAEKYGWSYDPSSQILYPKHNLKSSSFGPSSPIGEAIQDFP
jgi:hypothetical protein